MDEGSILSLRPSPANFSGLEKISVACQDVLLRCLLLPFFALLFLFCWSWEVRAEDCRGAMHNRPLELSTELSQKLQQMALTAKQALHLETRLLHSQKIETSSQKSAVLILKTIARLALDMETAVQSEDLPLFEQLMTRARQLEDQLREPFQEISRVIAPLPSGHQGFVSYYRIQLRDLSGQFGLPLAEDLFPRHSRLENLLSVLYQQIEFLSRMGWQETFDQEMRELGVNPFVVDPQGPPYREAAYRGPRIQWAVIEGKQRALFFGEDSVDLLDPKTTRLLERIQLAQRAFRALEAGIIGDQLWVRSRSPEGQEILELLGLAEQRRNSARQIFPLPFAADRVLSLEPYLLATRGAEIWRFDTRSGSADYFRISPDAFESATSSAPQRKRWSIQDSESPPRLQVFRQKASQGKHRLFLISSSHQREDPTNSTHRLYDLETGQGLYRFDSLHSLAQISGEGDRVLFGALDIDELHLMEIDPHTSEAEAVRVSVQRLDLPPRHPEEKSRLWSASSDFRWALIQRAPFRDDNYDRARWSFWQLVPRAEKFADFLEDASLVKADFVPRTNSMGDEVWVSLERTDRVFQLVGLSVEEDPQVFWSQKLEAHEDVYLTPVANRQAFWVAIVRGEFVRFRLIDRF